MTQPRETGPDEVTRANREISRGEDESESTPAETESNDVTRANRSVSRPKQTGTGAEVRRDAAVLNPPD